MVSKGYLRAWANSRDLLFVMDAEHETRGVRALSNATVVSHAYRTEHTTLDLEAEYARVESAALPAMRNLANGGTTTNEGEAAIVHFLDMHAERGRYADQAGVKFPIATANIYSGQVKMAEMGLGDRLVLSRHKELSPSVVRIQSLGVQKWRWRVVPVPSGLITGDGAVLMWEKRAAAGVTSITFPLSPSRLLVLGQDLDGLHIPLNELIAGRSRRWLVDHVDGHISRYFG